MLIMFFTRLFHLFVCILILSVFPLVICAQENKTEDPSAACKELPQLNEFNFISDLRAKLQGEITFLQAQKKSLEEVKIPAAKSAAKATGAGPNDNSENTDKQSNSSTVTAYGKTAEEYKSDLKQINDDISWKEAQLQCVISAQRDNPPLNFKFYMSVFFAALIGLVITGFFALAIIDEKVRQAVFSGQVGLQFLALFSIVIAIILFGITTILEAKELAALLGSLSGYILGRTTATTGNNDAKPSEPKLPMDAFAAIGLTPESLPLTVGTTGTLKAIPMDSQNNAIIPAVGEFTPQWISEDTAIATVDDKGTVTGVSAGKCNITAQFKGIRSPGCVVSVA